MENLGKINSIQLYKLWKNLTYGMVTVIAMMTFSKLLPYFLSPVVALVCAAFLYTFIDQSRVKRESSCMIVPMAMLYSLVSYAFVTILINVFYAWGWKVIPEEFVFFTGPFHPFFDNESSMFPDFSYFRSSSKKA